ncbi:SDR family NAD(P)-dependent oxidoreductase [Actinomadura keratinilytica]|uniref:SDR family oxidoreductase n=1 Tax=Actinomadura keratinilytica TaxID=547461 RepID=A0ABP7Y8E2_9ACTN
MTGKTVVITGASSGIGAAAARRLAAQGANVVPVGRSPERTAAVAAEIGAEPLVADFADLAQVRRLAGELLDRCERIDVLANNAGGLVSQRRDTRDGHELTFQANHLAPFLLTMLLLPRLREGGRTAPARVVMTSSLGNRFGRLRLDDLEWRRRRYGGGWICYSTTKLMNVMFTRELVRRYPDVTAYSFHPAADIRGPRGPETTYPRFGQDSRLSHLFEMPLLGRFRLTSEDGAKPLVWLASVPEVPAPNGTYFHGFKPGRTNPQAGDPVLAERLWDVSAEFVEEFVRDADVGR